MTLTRELLNQYSSTAKELKNINRKIDYYLNIVDTSEHGVVKGSMKEFPYAQKHFVLSGSSVKSDNERHEKIMQLLVKLQEQKQKYEDLVVDIGLAIEDVPEPEMNSIFFLKFVEGKTDKEIADTLGYERSTITKKIGAYFDDK
jgi:DNA-directed RNA polymerase specialized sigma24 family protein